MPRNLKHITSKDVGKDWNCPDCHHPAHPGRCFYITNRERAYVPCVCKTRLDLG